MSSTNIHYLLLFFALVGSAPAASAQSHSSAATQNRASTTTTAANDPLWTPADTGRMMPGDRDFSRHTPGMCLATINRVRRSVWRNQQGDTSLKSSGRDTLPTLALQAGQRCAAQFDGRDTFDIHLRDLMRLRVLLGDRPGAWAVTEARLSRMESDTARGTVLLEAINAELMAKPVRMPAVDSALSRLDALGDGAPFARMLGHSAVQRYALEQLFDTALVVRETRALMQLRPAFLNDTSSEAFGILAGAKQRLYYVAFYRVKDSTLPGVIDSITQDAIQQFGRFEDVLKMTQAWGAIVKGVAALVGMPTPPIDGATWYNKPVGDSFPGNGKVVLLTEGRKDFRDLEFLQRLRRLQEQYGPAGFQVVLYATPTGSSWQSPKQSLQDESNTIAWFLLEQLKLPFPLLVDSQIGNTYAIPGVLNRTLIGRDGKVRARALGLSGPMLDALVEQAVKE